MSEYITTVYEETQDFPEDILEEDTQPVDYAKVIFHVTNVKFGYYEYEFIADNSGDYIRIKPEDYSIEEDLCYQANLTNTTDSNFYIRISKSRYSKNDNEEYTRNDSAGTFVKIANKDGDLIEDEEDSVMIDISETQRYKKSYTIYKGNSTWNRTVNQYVKVPSEFGDYVENDISYKKLSNRSGQTLQILETLYNYNNDDENVDYGDGTKFKNFSFKKKDDGTDGNYVKETFTNINDWGDKWSPDSGSSNTATSSSGKYNHKPYFTYKVYIYRGDSESLEDSMTAIEKLNQDLENSTHDNAIKGTDNNPIIWEVGRHTRTNNFSYYRKGGPTPPTGYENQPDYYEVNFVPERFRIVLPEEDCSSNFTTNNPGSKIRDVTNTTNNKSRDAISFDKYSNSNDIEGCLPIMGRLENNRYVAMANASLSWADWNNLLIGQVSELGEVFGRDGHRDITIDTAENRTRVFMKIDAIPDIPTSI